MWNGFTSRGCWKDGAVPRPMSSDAADSASISILGVGSGLPYKLSQ